MATAKHTNNQPNMSWYFEKPTHTTIKVYLEKIEDQRIRHELM